MAMMIDERQSIKKLEPLKFGIIREKFGYDLAIKN